MRRGVGGRCNASGENARRGNQMSIHRRFPLSKKADWRRAYAAAANWPFSSQGRRCPRLGRRRMRRRGGRGLGDGFKPAEEGERQYLGNSARGKKGRGLMQGLADRAFGAGQLAVASRMLVVRYALGPTDRRLGPGIGDLFSCRRIGIRRRQHRHEGQEELDDKRQNRSQRPDALKQPHPRGRRSAAGRRLPARKMLCTQPKHGDHYIK